MPRPQADTVISPGVGTISPTNPAATLLSEFLQKFPETQYVRFEWVDYTGMRRLRFVPIDTVQKLVGATPNKHIAISSAVFYLCQNDFRTLDIDVVGQWALDPEWANLRTLTPTQATLMCSFIGDEGQPREVAACPRTALKKALLYAQDKHGVDFLVGFETEFLLLDLATFEQLKGVHAWSSTVPLNPKVMACIEEIMTKLRGAGIEVIYMHPEACSGQFEIVTGPLRPLQAIDAVYFTRQTIQTVAYNHGFRATLHPLPFPDQAGTAAHTHISVSRRDGSDSAGLDKPFFAGALEHLDGIMALTMPSTVSFDRVRDMCWAGGTWNCWGDHNRETPLRRSSEKDNHWEIRTVDATSNLYIAMAGIIYAGLDGLARDLKLPPGCEVDPATLTDEQRKERGIVRRLPRTLDAAISALKEDKALTGGLGEVVMQNFLSIKEAEARLFGSMEDGAKWRFLAEVY